MNNGDGVVQSPPIKKPKPANGVIVRCVDGTSTQLENATVTFDVKTLKIKSTGATVTYLCPTTIPEL